MSSCLLYFAYNNDYYLCSLSGIHYFRLNLYFLSSYLCRLFPENFGRVSEICPLFHKLIFCSAQSLFSVFNTIFHSGISNFHAILPDLLALSVW